MVDKEGKVISRQVLYDEIWTDSARKIAERYEITYSRFLKINPMYLKIVLAKS